LRREQGLGWDTSKVNVNGGAIAIGHPIGHRAAAFSCTLLYEMQKRNAEGPCHHVHRWRHGHRRCVEREPQLDSSHGLGYFMSLSIG
jgi:acetyl-CoA acetyltransferase